MAREARQLSPINSYLITLNAVDHIKFEQSAQQIFLQTLSKYSAPLNYSLLAYNLDATTISFVIYNAEEKLQTIMRKVTVAFVNRYNLIFANSGKIFKDRFKSTPALTDYDVWSMVANTHQNIEQNYFNDSYINLNIALTNFGNQSNFVKFAQLEKQKVQHTAKPSKITDADLIEFINHNIMPINSLAKTEKHKLSKAINKIIDNTPASARQIARITNLPLRLLWAHQKKKNMEVSND